MKRWIKRLFTTLFVLGFVGAIVYAFLPKPIAVDFGRVTRGSLQVCVEEDGKTRIKDRYIISAPLAGRLQRIRWKPGDRVAKGVPLALIEPADPALLDPRTLAQIEARVKAAKSAVEKAGTSLEWARAALDNAETEFASAEQLRQKGSLSKLEWEAKTMLRRTRAEEYRAARHAEDMAKSDLQLAEAALVRSKPPAPGEEINLHFEIPAPPISGSERTLHVLRVFQESEAIVAPGVQLLEVGDPSDLEVEIDVLSSDAVKIRPGFKTYLDQWGGDDPLEGRVRLVEPSGFTKISALGVEEQRVNVIVDFPDPEKVPDTLRDGFRVEARIVIWEREDVLRVPTSALFRKGEGWAVFRLEQNKAVLRPVKIGKRNGLEAEVVDGLSLDDVVVAHPSDKVTDGVEVMSRTALTK